MVRGYKVFNPDFTCLDFQYEVGKRYKHNGDILICNYGFHFCEKLVDCYNYYDFNEKNKIAEVVAHGVVTKKEDKSCTDDIEIIKEISWNECLNLVNFGTGNTGHRNTGDSNTGHRNTGHSNTGDSNTGDSNTGDSNTGDRNTGHRNTGHSNTGDSNTGHSNTGDSNTGDSNTGHSNTGHSNTGDSNTGHRNTGHSNTGDRNTGHRNTGDLNRCNYSSGVLCTTEQKILIFDKPSEYTLNEWRESRFAQLFYDYSTNKWVYESEMTEEEKVIHPKFYVQGGFLKVFTPEEAWKNWFKNKTEEDIKLLKQIPNFDSEKFEYITGIKI